MKKRHLIFWITVSITVFLVFYLIFSATFNVDNLGKGKLESITVVDKCIETSSCFNTQEISEIESEDEIESIESIFFYKFASNFLVYTKEEGNFNFIFHYEKTDIEFSALLDFEEMKGKIKYFERRKDFLIDRQGMTSLKEILKPQSLFPYVESNVKKPTIKLGVHNLDQEEKYFLHRSNKETID